MIGTLRKHSSWLWMIIIAATVVSFVIYFTPGSGGSRVRQGPDNYGTIDGARISQAEFVNAYHETMLVYFVATGGAGWPGKNAEETGFDTTRETYQRIFLIRKLDENNIRVDNKSVAEMANNILTQLGRGRPVSYDSFMKVLAAQQITPDDFQRYIRHQLGLQQLVAVIALSGDLVTPDEARPLYVRRHQEVATDAAFFSASNYLAGVQAPSPEALKDYYLENTNRYRIPERIQLSYVEFNISNFLAQAEREKTNLAEEVDMNMRSIGTNYLEFGKTLEEARAKVRDLVIRQQAAPHLRSQANEFANTLFNLEPVKAENLAALARTNGLTVRVTPPFDETDVPAEFASVPDFAAKVFRLTPDNPFAEPLGGKDAILIAALDKQIPPELPPLDAVRDRAIADYRHDHALSLARFAGERFAQSVSNGLAHGKTFAAICATSTVTPVTIPPISLSTTNEPAQLEGHVSLYQYQQLAFSTPVGKASEFSPTRDGGLVVHVRQQLPIDPAEMARNMPAFMQGLRQARRNEALNSWMQREGGKALQNIPAMQPRPESRGRS